MQRRVWLTDDTGLDAKVTVGHLTRDRGHSASPRPPPLVAQLVEEGCERASAVDLPGHGRVLVLDTRDGPGMFQKRSHIGDRAR
jgi:hypothetical protein